MLVKPVFKELYYSFVKLLEGLKKIQTNKQTNKQTKQAPAKKQKKKKKKKADKKKKKNRTKYKQTKLNSFSSSDEAGYFNDITTSAPDSGKDVERKWSKFRIQ